MYSSNYPIGDIKIVAENSLYSGVTGKKHPVDDTATADLGEHIII